MPNHVTNILRIGKLNGFDLGAVRATFLNDQRKVDFNKIVAMPECLRDFSAHSGVTSRAEMALGLLKEPTRDTGDIQSLTSNMHFSNAMRDATRPVAEKDVNDVIRAIKNYAECGFITWYEWAIQNWDTKWNAYQQPDEGFEDGATEFEFQTAWSHPYDLITKISEANPAVRFDVQFADEDLGSNCGTYSIKDGLRSDENIAPRWGDQSGDQKKTFMKLAFRINYGDDDPATHGYDKNWEYSDEIYDANQVA